MDVTRLRFPAALALASLMAVTGCSAEDPADGDTDPEEAHSSNSGNASEKGEGEESVDETSDDTTYPEFSVPDAANRHGGIEVTSPTQVAEGEALGTQSRGDVPDEDSELPGGLDEPVAGEPLQMVIFTELGAEAHAADFEAEYGEFIEELLDAGDISVEYRIVAVSPGRTPAAGGAAACVADESPEDYFSFVRALADHDVPGHRGADDPTDDELIHVAERIGVPQAEECIRDGRYTSFVWRTLDVAQTGGVTGFPTIFLGGEEWEPSGEPFQDWVQSRVDAHS